MELVKKRKVLLSSDKGPAVSREKVKWMEVKEELIAIETVTKKSKHELRTGFIDLIRKAKKGLQTKMQP